MSRKTVREHQVALADAEARIVKAVTDAATASEVSFRAHLRTALATHQEQITVLLDAHLEAVKTAVTAQPASAEVHMHGDAKAIAAELAALMKPLALVKPASPGKPAPGKP